MINKFYFNYSNKPSYLPQHLYYTTRCDPINQSHSCSEGGQVVKNPKHRKTSYPPSGRLSRGEDQNKRAGNISHNIFSMTSTTQRTKTKVGGQIQNVMASSLMVIELKNGQRRFTQKENHATDTQKRDIHLAHEKKVEGGYIRSKSKSGKTQANAT